jgi:D-sedoheptulose 7-phosphate isomerase
MKNVIVSSILDSIDVKQEILKTEKILEQIDSISNFIVQSLENGGRILFCGNGGSAADAQHLSAELSGRFKIDREPLDAEALHVNTSYITAVGNDYSYDEIFSRLVKAKGRAGDILIGLSTSGNSKNVLKAFEAAKQKGMLTIALTGSKENAMEKTAHVCIKVPSTDTARIQESHIMIGHIVCDLVEKRIFQ